MGLTDEQIAVLLAPKVRKTKVETPTTFPHYKPPPQVGPLKFYDVTLYCQHISGERAFKCMSPTAYKFQGTAYCVVHLLHTMNTKLIDLGVDN